MTRLELHAADRATGVSGTAGRARRPPPRHLIGLVPCLAFAVGSMVGGGVFTLSGAAINRAGPSAIVSYLLAGAVMGLSALCFVTVAARARPGDSGYGAVGDLLGPVWRFLVMWSFYLNGVLAVTFLLVSFGDYLERYFAGSADPVVVGVAAGVAITGLNLGPIRRVARAETWIVAAKIALLLLFVAWGTAEIRHAHLLPFVPHQASGTVGAAALLFTAYTGFNVVTNMAASVRRPARTVPTAVMLAVGLSALIYVGTVAAMLASGIRHFGTAGVAEAAASLMGHWGGLVIAFAACLSTLSGANAQVLASSELMLRLVAQGDVPPVAGRQLSRDRPFVSVVTIGVVSVVLVCVAGVGEVIVLSNVAALAAMVITDAAAARLVLRGWPGPGPRLPLGLVIPVVAALSCLAQFISFGLRQTLIGLAVVAAGLLLYAGRRLGWAGENVRDQMQEAIALLETPLLRAVRRMERHTRQAEPAAAHPMHAPGTAGTQASGTRRRNATMTTQDLRSAVSALMPRARTDLATLVALRSVADPANYPPEECEKAAHLVARLFGEAGLADAALHETPDGSDAVIARVPAPAGRPTVLLYCHYDVQPPLADKQWRSPPFQLTERNGRWYGRGAADCKGNIVTHLTSLRALAGRGFPVGIVAVAEGSEEQGTGGLEAFVRAHPDLLRADAMLICDAGNSAVGVPTLTTSLRGLVTVTVHVRALTEPAHSGTFGGAAPDALAALVRMLGTLTDEHGNVTIRGLEAAQRWAGEGYPAGQLRADAGVADGVALLGDGAVADMVWARPSVTIIGIDCPPVSGSSPVIQAAASARLSLRIPPGTSETAAQDALIGQLRAVAPWHVQVSFEAEKPSAPLRLRCEGPAHDALVDAMEDAFGASVVTRGEGGSIPLCSVLAETYPDAELAVIGVEEPRCQIHAPNESVDPAEIARLALAEALFLQNYAAAEPVGPR